MRALALATSAGLLTMSTASAAGIVCTVEQVTDTVGLAAAIEPSIDGSGTRIAFRSSGNLTGDNPDGSQELYVYDTTTSILSQVTDLDGLIDEFKISNDGSYVALTSSASLFGTFEVFRADTASLGAVQLTPDSFSGTGNISIDHDGSTIAFTSSKDLTGDNPNFRDQLFLSETAGGFIQVTNFADGQGPEATSLSASGRRVAFQINDAGTRRLYYADAPGAPLLAASEAVSLGAGGPSISDDGAAIVFVSADDGNDELFLHDLVLGTTEQLTFTTGSLALRQPASNATGERLAFDRTNGFTSEVLILDVLTGEECSLAPGASALAASINDDGRRIAFQSGANLTGGNPDGSFEIFLADCDPPATRAIQLRLDAVDLLWDAAEGATAYDLVQGDLATLRLTGGDFATATDFCPADDHVGTNFPHGIDPSPGNGYWFLVRVVSPSFTGTYDARTLGQVAPRDAGIASSGWDCF
ncbi:MAG: hypothetical protein OEV00_03095 [Acidobacteriota bacterium]|nr:hypothetical protein [Acidobacteriota bacterium]MDH3784295.1 hypothetical protein [Acidobacteriota bacterium]